jgi:four helix bundle protein
VIPINSFSLRCSMGDFAKLHVWRKAHALALNVHRVAIGIRGPSYASLRSQLIRSAMSIPANIVEGRGQKSERQFGRFLGYAINSSSELEYHLIVARDAKLISLADSRSLLDQTIEVRRMLHGLLRSLSNSEHVSMIR